MGQIFLMPELTRCGCYKKWVGMLLTFVHENGTKKPMRGAGVEPANARPISENPAHPVTPGR
jgi:hypothetical protein